MTLRSPTPTQRRDASALLAGCHPPWRRQRPDHALLTRPDWHRLLPLVAETQRHHPDLPLSAVLTDRVASARSLPAVLTWRLWQLLRQTSPQDTPPQQSPAQPTPPDQTAHSDDRHQHLPAVRTLGGPAAARDTLATAESPSARSLAGV